MSKTVRLRFVTRASSRTVNKVINMMNDRLRQIELRETDEKIYLHSMILPHARISTTKDIIALGTNGANFLSPGTEILTVIMPHVIAEMVKKRYIRYANPNGVHQKDLTLFEIAYWTQIYVVDPSKKGDLNE